MDVDYLAVIEREGAELLAAARRGRLDAPVPGCPGWALADLVWHVGEVHDFWGTVVRDRLGDPSSYAEPERPADVELVGFAAERLDRLLDALRDADPATPVWSWTTRKDVGFVFRRMAHETTVHRMDAQAALGDARPIDAAFASDGIDEFLEHFTADVIDGEAPLAGSVHLHCTDVDGEWLVRPTPDGLETTREHAKGDAAMRGPAPDLLMVLWRRAPLSTVDVIGDAAVAEQLVRRTNLD